MEPTDGEPQETVAEGSFAAQGGARLVVGPELFSVDTVGENGKRAGGDHPSLEMRFRDGVTDGGHAVRQPAAETISQAPAQASG
jgi:hypothetical protein